MCTNIGHSPPEGGPGHPGAGRHARLRQPVHGHRSRAPGSARSSPRSRPATSTRSSSPTAAPRPTRTRSASRASSPGGTRCWRATARTTAARRARSRSPATRAAGPPSRASPASCAPPTSTSGAAASPSRVDVCLRELEDVIRYEGGQTIAAFVIEPVVGTNGILVPPDGYMQGVRELCDRHGILLDRRRGDVRLRPHRPVVRGRPLERRARPHDDGQGPDVGLRAARARWACGRRSPHAFQDRAFPGGLTYNSHPLACAAALATHRRLRGRGPRSSTPRRMGEVLRERMLGASSAAPLGRAPRARSACSASSSWCATATRTSRWRPTTARPRR